MRMVGHLIAHLKPITARETMSGPMAGAKATPTESTVRVPTPMNHSRRRRWSGGRPPTPITMPKTSAND